MTDRRPGRPEAAAVEGGGRRPSALLIATGANSWGGGYVVLSDLRDYLASHDTGVDWTFLLSAPILEPGPSVKIRILEQPKRSWLHRLYFDLVGASRLLERISFDVIVSMQNTLPFGLRRPTVLFIQQALPFVSESGPGRLNRRSLLIATYKHLIGYHIKSSARRSSMVVVQAEWMRSAVSEATGKDQKMIVVARPAAQVGQSVVSSETSSHVAWSSFIYPCAALPYKNLQCLNDAIELLRPDDGRLPPVAATVSGEKLSPRIRQIGRIAHGEIMDLLAKSTLVFPSLVETVGLPLLEARSLNTYILAADLPYANEALDGYANVSYFNPRDPAQLALLMQRITDGLIFCEPAHQANSSQTDTWEPLVIQVLRLSEHG